MVGLKISFVDRLEGASEWYERGWTYPSLLLFWMLLCSVGYFCVTSKLRQVCVALTTLQQQPEHDTNCTVSNVAQRSVYPENMGAPAAKFPIERRRAKPPEVSIPALLQYNRPHTRRESDLVRMRIQHWMDLADAALRSPRLHHKTPRAVR